jgi:hypothetical protein
VQVDVVPEPSTFVLIGLFLLGLHCCRHRSFRS